MKNAPTISQFGDHGVLIQFEGVIQLETNHVLTQLTQHLLNEFESLIEGCSIAYQESVIYFHPQISMKSTLRNLKEEIASFGWDGKNIFEKRILEIPVCYQAPFALDIEEIAKEKKLEVPTIIDLHTAPIYPVYFIGFAPGFPYLGGMNKKLAYPRKASPRRKVDAGAVGIANEQTGIYPNTSPGGWNIIGQSPLQFFDIEKETPSFLEAGDAIQFTSIDKNQFKEIEQQVKNGTYDLQKIIKND